MKSFLTSRGDNHGSVGLQTKENEIRNGRPWWWSQQWTPRQTHSPDVLLSQPIPSLPELDFEKTFLKVYLETLSRNCKMKKNLTNWMTINCCEWDRSCKLMMNLVNMLVEKPRVQQSVNVIKTNLLQPVIRKQLANESWKRWRD